MYAGIREAVPYSLVSSSNCCLIPKDSNCPDAANVTNFRKSVSLLDVLRRTLVNPQHSSRRMKLEAHAIQEVSNVDTSPEYLYSCGTGSRQGM